VNLNLTYTFLGQIKNLATFFKSDALALPGAGRAAQLSDIQIATVQHRVHVTNLERWRDRITITVCLVIDEEAQMVFAPVPRARPFLVTTSREAVSPDPRARWFLVTHRQADST
jgi:hypothetical protein